MTENETKQQPSPVVFTETVERTVGRLVIEELMRLRESNKEMAVQVKTAEDAVHQCAKEKRHYTHAIDQLTQENTANEQLIDSTRAAVSGLTTILDELDGAGSGGTPVGKSMEDEIFRAQVHVRKLSKQYRSPKVGDKVRLISIPAKVSPSANFKVGDIYEVKYISTYTPPPNAQSVPAAALQNSDSDSDAYVFHFPFECMEPSGGEE